MTSINSESSDTELPGMTVEGHRLIISNEKELFDEAFALLVILGVVVVFVIAMIGSSFLGLIRHGGIVGGGIVIIGLCIGAVLYYCLPLRTLRVELDKNNGLLTAVRMRYLFFTKTITTTSLSEIVRIRQITSYVDRDIQVLSKLDVKVYLETTDGKKIFLFKENHKAPCSSRIAQFLSIPIEKDPVPAWRHFI